MITKLTQITSPYQTQAQTIQPGEKVLPVNPQLEIGKILSATVIESRGQNVFMLETADIQLAVQSKFPLAKGEQIQFQVLNTDPVLELQKVDPGLPSKMRQTLTLTGEAINVKPLLQNLQSSFFAASKPLQATTGSSQNVSMQKMDAGAVEQLIRQGTYTVKATVIENLGENKSMIRIAGETYTLNGRLSAEPGESKVLQLQSLQPTISFSPVNDKGVANQTQPLTLNTDKQSLPALVRALQLPIFTGLNLLQPTQQQLLQNLHTLQPAQLQKPDAGEILKQSLEQLGLRSEALVAQGKGQKAATQLKSVLAEIARIFQGQEEISSTANRLLATLETNQFVQASLQQENNLLFPLAFSFLEKGYLLIEQEGGQQEKEGDTDESFACTLHLALEGLGNVRVRFVQSEESIRIAFYLDTEEKADFVSTFETELKENISSAPLLTLSFASGADSPGTALLQKIIPAEHPILKTSA